MQYDFRRVYRKMREIHELKDIDTHKDTLNVLATF